MKRFIILILTLFNLTIISSCQIAQMQAAAKEITAEEASIAEEANKTEEAIAAKETNTAEPEKLSEKFTVIDIKTDITDIEGLNILRENAFELDESVRIALYTDAEMYEGEFSFDDGNDFALYCFVNGKAYPLLPKEYIQLGEINYSAYYSQDGILNVLAEKRASAGIKIFNFEYNRDEQVFYKQDVFSAEGINLFLKY